MSFPSQASGQAAPHRASDLLVLGRPSSLGNAVTQALSDAGWQLQISAPDQIPAAVAASPIAAMLLLPPALPRGDAMVAAEDFIAMLDDAFVPVSLAIRDLVARRDDSQQTRIVVLVGGAVTGPAGATPAAAAMGGLLGLARSWALEFAPLRVTVNAVIAGIDPDADPAAAGPGHVLPSPDARTLAHAVRFFLDPEAASITGQVLTVCGGRLSGLIPV